MSEHGQQPDQKSPDQTNTGQVVASVPRGWRHAIHWLMICFAAPQACLLLCELVWGHEPEFNPLAWMLLFWGIAGVLDVRPGQVVRSGPFIIWLVATLPIFLAMIVVGQAMNVWPTIVVILCITGIAAGLVLKANAMRAFTKLRENRFRFRISTLLGITLVVAATISSFGFNNLFTESTRRSATTSLTQFRDFEYTVQYHRFGWQTPKVIRANSMIQKFKTGGPISSEDFSNLRQDFHYMHGASTGVFVETVDGVSRTSRTTTAIDLDRFEQLTNVAGNFDLHRVISQIEQEAANQEK